MKKSVLIISASARKGGNSDILCDQFLKGAQETGNEVEKIYLRDNKIEYCVGCLVCQSNGGHCIHKDDMSKILDKMVNSDVIVLATPVYFYTMNGQLKTMIDRMNPRFSELIDKEFYLIASAADSSKNAIDIVEKELEGLTSCLAGSKIKGIIYGVGVCDVGDIRNSKEMEKAYEMGKTI